MSGTLRLAVLLAGLIGTTPALAGEAPKGVVEIFTSQGCVSCPPADAALARLVQRGDVVALGYHVDYWNYLGWADTLASAENTERQYGYARSMGRSGVYTPQAIVNGRDHVMGADLAAIDQRLQKLAGQGRGLTVPVRASLSGDEIEIDIGSGSGEAEVVVAYFTRRQEIDITRGENSGKRITYWHSVRDLHSVGMWHGGPAKFRLSAKLLGKAKRDGCAILLQTSGRDGEPAAIIGAAVLMPARRGGKVGE